MRLVIQRVKHASVTIDGAVTAEIEEGLAVLIGITQSDTAAQADYLARKCTELRVFEDDQGKMNRSLIDIGAEMLIVSQFTLYADCRKGCRPSFTSAAPPIQAIPLYERFIESIKSRGIPVQTGSFGADMKLVLLNDGPVTIIMDTEQMCRKGKEDQI